MSKNYSAKELVGIRIAHDFEDFIEDQEIVLTLLDKPILAGNEKIDEEGDILENQQMKEHFTTDFYNKQKINKNNSSLEDRYDTEKKLLPHYDEKKPEKKGIILDDQGSFDINKINKLDLIKKKLKTSNDNSISLDVEKKIASEYVQPQPKIFPKPQMKKKIKKSNDLISFLEENADKADFSNYGTHEAKKLETTQNVRIEAKEKIDKLTNYNNALEKAQVQTELTLKRKGVDFSKFMEDEDEQLEKSVQKQLKLFQEKTNVEETVRSFIENNSKLEENNFKNNQADFSIAFDIKKPIDDKFKKEEISSILTSSEFLKNVRTEQESQENYQKIMAPNKLSIKDSKEGMTSVVNVPLPSEKLISYSKNTGFQSVSRPSITPNPNANKIITDNEPENEIYDEKFLEAHQEDLEKELGFFKEEGYGVGLSGVLKRLRERGELEPNSDDYSGRTNDKLPHEELAKFESAPSDKIKLEYRDQHGKLMTQREAFRYLCWTFHGKKPSKRKIEKKIKKEQMKSNPKTKNIGETPLMKAFNRVQANSNQAYLVLSQTKPE